MEPPSRRAEALRFSLVREITRADLAGVLKAIADRGAERQAELVAAALRRYWRWLGSDVMTTKTGVAAGAMDGLRAPERTLVEDDDDDGDKTSRVPVADDLRGSCGGCATTPRRR